MHGCRQVESNTQSSSHGEEGILPTGTLTYMYMYNMHIVKLCFLSYTMYKYFLSLSGGIMYIYIYHLKNSRTASIIILSCKINMYVYVHVQCNTVTHPTMYMYMYITLCLHAFQIGERRGNYPLPGFLTSGVRQLLSGCLRSEGRLSAKDCAYMAALSEATDHEQKTRITEKLGCKQNYNIHLHGRALCLSVECCGFESHPRQLIFLRKVTALCVLCCFALLFI